jgi:hypothetical protein
MARSRPNTATHRPVRAGGDPEHGIPHDVVCSYCLIIWPCRPALLAERYRARIAGEALALHFKKQHAAVSAR